MIDLLESMRQSHVIIPTPKIPTSPNIIHCPICGKAYDLTGKIPERSNHVTIECNNPICREHMNLWRNEDRSWRVEFRDREGFKL